jgi:hypothetical protein
LQWVQTALRRIVRITLNITDMGELLGHVLAEWLHGVVAVRATRIRFEHLLIARQMGRQRLLRGGCTDGRARARCAGTANICDTTSTGQLLQFGLEPLDLPVQLLGLAPELHPFEFVDLRLELFDLEASSASWARASIGKALSASTSSGS